MRAWRSIGRFRGESTFRTWLHRIAINVVRTHHVKQNRWLQRFRPLEEEPEPAAGDEAVDTQLVRRQLIDRALGALPEDLRLAVTLRDVQGLDYREIAEALDIPIGTVESRIFRARQRLKPLLQEIV